MFIFQNLELWAFCIGRLASWRSKHWLLPLTPCAIKTSHETLDVVSNDDRASSINGRGTPFANVFKNNQPCWGRTINFTHFKCTVQWALTNMWVSQYIEHFQHPESFLVLLTDRPLSLPSILGSRWSAFCYYSFSFLEFRLNEIGKCGVFCIWLFFFFFTLMFWRSSMLSHVSKNHSFFIAE